MGFDRLVAHDAAASIKSIGESLTCYADAIEEIDRLNSVYASKCLAGREAIKLVMQKMIDPKMDWTDTVFVNKTETLYERLAVVYETLDGKDLCDCGGGGCPDCGHTGFKFPYALCDGGDCGSCNSGQLCFSGRVYPDHWFASTNCVIRKCWTPSRWMIENGKKFLVDREDHRYEYYRKLGVVDENIPRK
jgi:hypothetical protein